MEIILPLSGQICNKAKLALVRIRYYSHTWTNKRTKKLCQAFHLVPFFKHHSGIVEMVLCRLKEKGIGYFRSTIMHTVKKLALCKNSHWMYRNCEELLACQCLSGPGLRVEHRNAAWPLYKVLFYTESPVLCYIMANQCPLNLQLHPRLQKEP